VVLYHGMWHPWHGLPYVYEAARLLEDDPRIVFVVIPKDHEPDRKNLLFVEEQRFERLPVYLQMADAWCSGFDSDARGERTFSSTLVQSLALGLPVITGRTGERATTLRDGVEARLLPLRDARAIADAVRSGRARWARAPARSPRRTFRSTASTGRSPPSSRVSGEGKDDGCRTRRWYNPVNPRSRRTRSRLCG